MLYNLIHDITITHDLLLHIQIQFHSQRCANMLSENPFFVLIDLPWIYVLAIQHTRRLFLSCTPIVLCVRSVALFDVRRCLLRLRRCRRSSALAIIWLGQYFRATRGGERILRMWKANECLWKEIDVDDDDVYNAPDVSLEYEREKPKTNRCKKWWYRHSSPSFHPSPRTSSSTVLLDAHPMIIRIKCYY